MTYITYNAKRSRIGDGTNVVSVPELFNSSYWLKTGITVSSDTSLAPNLSALTDSALRVLEDNTSASHVISRSLTSLVSSTYYTLSVYSKVGSRSFARLRWTTKAGSEINAWYDVGSGVVASVTNGGSAAITTVHSGWYRLSLGADVNSGGVTAQIAFGPVNSLGNVVYTGTTSASIWFWGAMVNSGTIADYPHVLNREYYMEGDLLQSDRSVRFSRDRQVSIGGSVETLFNRQDTFYRLNTGYYTETEMKNWREFLDSVAGGETFNIDVYGTVASHVNVFSAILESANYSESRRGTLFTYSVAFEVKQL